MSRDVKRYVTTCSVCSQNKKIDCYGRCPLTEYVAGAPMERVHIDFLGPLPKTPRGNEHILMMVDQFTKWVECVPLPSQTADVTARAAVDEFFSRFGCPLHIFSDQGRNFESRLFRSLCEVLEIHKTRTTPYRPSANGQVERYNRTLMDAVRCFIGPMQTDWDLHVQQIAGAMRSAVNRSTGFTPNYLMLGREVNIPAHVMFPDVAVKHSENVNEFVSNMVTNMEKAHSTARASLKTSTRRMKRNYDLRILKRTYEKGDVVYILDTASLKGKCKKLSPPWKGPAVITEKISAYLYRIKLRNAIFVANHDRMKPCKATKLPLWVSNWLKDPVPAIIDASTDDSIHCLCKEPWQGRFMIQCDFCDKWYHGSCVNVTATEALNIAQFRCAACLQVRCVSC